MVPHTTELTPPPESLDGELEIVVTWVPAVGAGVAVDHLEVNDVPVVRARVYEAPSIVIRKLYADDGSLTLDWAITPEVPLEQIAILVVSSVTLASRRVAGGSNLASGVTWRDRVTVPAP